MIIIYWFIYLFIFIRISFIIWEFIWFLKLLLIYFIFKVLKLFILILYEKNTLENKHKKS